MKRFLSLAPLALALSASAANVKISDLALVSTPSTNTFMEIADLNASGTNKSAKILYTNLVAQSQLDNATFKLKGSDGDLSIIKSVPYSWPTANAAGVFSNDGSGNLTWASTGTTNTVWVNRLATAGDGSTGLPWTGWDASSLTNAFTQYIWPAGNYSFASTINLLGTNTYHSGQAGTILHYTGSGVAVKFSAVATWIQGTAFENFRIDCTSASRPTQSITSITNAAPSGIHTAYAHKVNHGYSTGDILDISGADQADYNITRAITVTGPDDFTYQLRSFTSAATPATTSTSFQARKSSVALQLIGVRNGNFQNIALANCSLGLHLQACVTDTFSNIRCTKYEEPAWTWTIVPNEGVLIDQRISTATDATTTQYFDNLIIEGVSGVGLVINAGWDSSFSGTSEVNGSGVEINRSSVRAELHNFDIEANTSTNTGKGLWIAGDQSVVRNCVVADPVVLAHGSCHQLIGGYFSSTVNLGADTTEILGATLTSQSNYTDTEDQANRIGMRYESGGMETNKLSATMVKGFGISQLPFDVQPYPGTTNDLLRVRVTTTNMMRLDSAGSLRLLGAVNPGAGSSSAPAFVMGADTFGFYQNSGGQWTTTSGGLSLIDSYGFRVTSGFHVDWTAGLSTASADSGISRADVNFLKVTKGSTTGIGQLAFREHLQVGTGATLATTNSIYLCNVDAQLITLPSATNISGKIFTIKLIAPAATGTVTNSGGQTIDGANSYSLSASNKFVRLTPDGTNWWIIGSN